MYKEYNNYTIRRDILRGVPFGPQFTTATFAVIYPFFAPRRKLESLFKLLNHVLRKAVGKEEVALRTYRLEEVLRSSPTLRISCTYLIWWSHPQPTTTTTLTLCLKFHFMSRRKCQVPRLHLRHIEFIKSFLELLLKLISSVIRLGGGFDFNWTNVFA